MKVIKVESSNQFRAANLSQNPSFKGFQNCIKPSALTEEVFTDTRILKLNQIEKVIKKMKTNVSLFVDKEIKQVCVMFSPNNPSVANNSALEKLTTVQKFPVSKLKDEKSFNNFLLSIAKNTNKIEKAIDKSAKERKVLIKVQKQKV